MGDSNKKISPVSASAQSRPKCFSFPFVWVRRRSIFRRLGISIPADFGFGKELSSGWQNQNMARRAEQRSSTASTSLPGGRNRLRLRRQDGGARPERLGPIGQPADLTSSRPVRRRNPPFAGVTAVCASQALRSSTCTMVLPICSCHERMTTSSRTTTV